MDILFYNGKWKRENGKLLYSLTAMDLLNGKLKMENGKGVNLFYSLWL